MDENTFKNLEARVENLQQNLLASAQIQNGALQSLTQLKDLMLHFQTTQLQDSHPNPLNAYGKKCFSQADEDGITIEIIRRLGLSVGTFAEFGVGDGLQNNTLILTALGWSGFWVGGEDLAFDYSKATKFHYIKNWITLDNIIDLTNLALQSLSIENVDVLSLDLDGNDIFLVDRLLSSGLIPKLCVVEYNAKFIPPAKFQITYDPDHHWSGDDYFGAALTNFVEMFERHGYKLICCNSHTGANAFFIKKDFDYLFNDVPNNISDIYVQPRYHLYTNYGHPQSRKVVEELINK